MSMNGAQALIRTLADSGVEVCFSNPGTSEMHFVAALDSVPEMRAVLCLFEGVVTGAADGYGRMADKPAATLLHLGSGLSNGMANLHNARRAYTPIVNIVGDHATYHKRFDAPLDSDIKAAAGVFSHWLRTSSSTARIGLDTAEAVAASMDAPRGVATLILPADVSWGDGGRPAVAQVPIGSRPVGDRVFGSIADVLRSGEATTILLGGAANRERGLRAASRISVATGAKVFVETFPTRLERGAGLPTVERFAYLAEQAIAQLADVKHLVLAGVGSPVSFFAYPSKPSDLVPEGCQTHVLATRSDDVVAALENLADRVATGVQPLLQPAQRPEMPAGKLTLQNWTSVIGAVLPERAIIVDESNTSGFLLAGSTAGAPRHDILTLTGGAIGIGMPMALGAALACPDRPVINLQGDGSAMYTVSALWSQAREGANVTTVLLANRAYAILRLELQRVGAAAGGPKAKAQLDLTNPNLDFVSLATGMGVPASRATTCGELATQFKKALAEPGPHLIEAIVPPLI